MNLKSFIILLVLCVSLYECTSYKSIVYLNDILDSIPGENKNSLQDFDALIQKNDILSIKISSLNSQDVQLLNPSQAAGQAGGSQSGYLVDKNGEIKVPFLGAVLAEGLSKNDLEKVLVEKLKDYTKDPVVAIRFLNSKVTILGEVNRPGPVNPETDRLTVLDAIGDAGDLKITARRDNVLVIRDINGKRTIGRLNLLSRTVFRSPYFYLKPRDIVYVEPVKASYSNRNDFFTRYIGITASLVSILISILVLTKK